jgi:hypothetical protein
MLQGELRDSCLAPGLEIRDTKAYSPVKPPLNCFHTPIPDPIDLWGTYQRRRCRAESGLLMSVLLM